MGKVEQVVSRRGFDIACSALRRSTIQSDSLTLEMIRIVGDKVRREKALGFSGRDSRRTLVLAPMAIEVAGFSVTKKHSFLGIFLWAGQRQFRGRGLSTIV